VYDINLIPNPSPNMEKGAKRIMNVEQGLPSASLRRPKEL
jgi:hypothetical protein